MIKSEYNKFKKKIWQKRKYENEMKQHETKIKGKTERERHRKLAPAFSFPFSFPMFSQKAFAFCRNSKFNK